MKNSNYLLHSFLVLFFCLMMVIGQEPQIYESSGQIKIGFGNDFDRSGNLISPGAGGTGPPMPEKIEYQQPVIKDQDDNQPDYISFPAQVMAPAYKQKPIVIVPEIIYPHIRKRVIIHHNNNLQQVYRNAMYNNPYLMNLAVHNPYYKKFVTPKISNTFRKLPVPSIPEIDLKDEETVEANAEGSGEGESTSSGMTAGLMGMRLII